jgi:hypothetical protein
VDLIQNYAKKWEFFMKFLIAFLIVLSPIAPVDFAKAEAASCSRIAAGAKQTTIRGPGYGNDIYREVCVNKDDSTEYINYGIDFYIDPARYPNAFELYGEKVIIDSTLISQLLGADESKLENFRQRINEFFTGIDYPIAEAYFNALPLLEQGRFQEARVLLLKGIFGAWTI